MPELTLAHLGPTGTYSEMAAIAYAESLAQQGQASQLQLHRTIQGTLQAVVRGDADQAIVPVENSIEGQVPASLDTLWQSEGLQVQKTLVLPIRHALISTAVDLGHIRIVRSHPQALAQCRDWMAVHIPTADQQPSNSTSEALAHLRENPNWAAIASERAAHLYDLPILAQPINDQPDNCTRFWVVGPQPSPGGSLTSLAFSLPANEPGALMRALEIFARRQLNMSRIESRPTKRSLGEYLFFVDLEANARGPEVQDALGELATVTEDLRLLGSYDLLDLSQSEPD